MDQFFQSLDLYLSHQPWWMIVVVSSIITIFIMKISGTSKDANVQPSSDLSIKPVMPHHSEVKLNSADTQQIQSLLLKGDKIGAIKLIRERTGLDLLNAKNMAEAMSKR